MKTIKQPTAVIYLLLLSGEWGEVKALPELPDSNWKAHTAKTAPPSRREVHWGCPFSHGCPSQCLHNSSFILCLKSQRGPINTNNHLSFQLASLRCPSCFWRRNSRLRVRGIKPEITHRLDSLSRERLFVENTEWSQTPGRRNSRVPRVSPPFHYRAPSDRSDVISRSCLDFWTRLLLIALQCLRGFLPPNGRATKTKLQSWKSLCLFFYNRRTYRTEPGLFGFEPLLIPRAPSCVREETEETVLVLCATLEVEEAPCLPWL